MGLNIIETAFLGWIAVIYNSIAVYRTKDYLSLYHSKVWVLRQIKAFPRGTKEPYWTFWKKVTRSKYCCNKPAEYPLLYLVAPLWMPANCNCLKKPLRKCVIKVAKVSETKACVCEFLKISFSTEEDFCKFLHLQV